MSTNEESNGFLRTRNELLLDLMWIMGTDCKLAQSDMYFYYQ
jgi:hypothetical protein